MPSLTMPLRSEDNFVSYENLQLADGVEILFEHLPGSLFYVKDARGRFVTLNAPLVDQLGAERKSEIIGRTDVDFLPEYLVENYRRDDERVLAGEVIREKVELLTSHDGVVDWYVTTKVPLKNRAGRIVALVGVTREYQGATASVAMPQVLGDTLEYIREHFHEGIRISDLASRAGLSVSAFERRFRKHLQMPPTEYIRRVRIHEACRSLIHSGVPISVISQECGFSDQSHFTRDFVRVMQTTPAVYRRNHGLNRSDT